MKLTPVNHDPFKKATKASASYSRGMKSSHCGICEFYSNHACSKVSGAIDPAYWCRLFVKKRKGFAEGGAPEMTAPFPEAPGGYPFFTADSASDTPSGVLPSELPPVDVPPAEHGPVAGFIDKAVDWWKNQPSWLEQAQQQSQRDIEAYNQSGVKGLMADTGTTQDLAGGFGGTTIGTAGKIAKAAMPVANDMGFYSAVEHAVNSAPQTKASPQQWLGTIKNTPGVKPEEMEWTGLSDWLSQQKGPVSKEQVADFVKANQIDIKEVAKEEKRTSVTGRTLFQDRDEAAQRLYDTSSYDKLASEQKRHVDDELASKSPTKFGSYTLPGGENYRELLLTLPQDGAREVGIKNATERLDQIQNEFDKLHTQETYNTLTGAEDPAIAAQRQELAKEKVDLTRQLYELHKSESTNFKSSHWDEPNVLAHIRMNDRMIDGKKTLFVEEVQSDWHQKGKRQGYQSNQFALKEPTGETYEVYPTRAAAEREMQPGMTIHEVPGTGVPDAPFKTTWPELSMKRVLKYAADNGYDKVAWTPGDVQAARYDLSKHVDEIHYDADKQRLAYKNKGSDTWNEVEDVPKDKLANYIGKDAAEKILNTHPSQGIHKLQGVDLKVGGEGMKGFYDQILPATVNKLVKKYGAKVEKKEITTSLGWAADEEKGVRGAKDITHPAHTVDITPQMKKAISEQGFPQFSTGGSVKPRLVSVAHNPFEAHTAARRAMHGHKHT